MLVGYDAFEFPGKRRTNILCASYFIGPKSSNFRQGREVLVLDQT